MGSSLCHADPLLHCMACLVVAVSSVVTAHGLSCPMACGILVPRPGIEPTSPALQGGFLIIGPLG